MTIKLPQIIGHRGVAAYAPENTLESIHMAADMEIKWVKLDVKITKDQIPIIFHDDTLERTTSSSGNISDITYEDLQQLDAGSWFGDSFIGVSVPTLEEAIEVLIDRNLGLNLEINPSPGHEKETAEIALDILSQYWDEHEKLLISSFSHVSLETAIEMAEDWHRGLCLPSQWPENWAELADYLKVSAINVNGNDVTQEQIQSIININLPILAYTINDPKRAHILQSWGVNGIFSDSPDIIKDGLLNVH
ncbi:MAG: glycerophosphoryl diester phosphodiesterase [Alphaproteobacteria bacterium]|nr:glycerophosphoryl diester phosphodiesterase [Alphaproteobacteria bacterium]